MVRCHIIVSCRRRTLDVSTRLCCCYCSFVWYLFEFFYWVLGSLFLQIQYISQLKMWADFSCWLGTSSYSFSFKFSVFFFPSVVRMEPRVLLKLSTYCIRSHSPILDLLSYCPTTLRTLIPFPGNQAVKRAVSTEEHGACCSEAGGLCIPGQLELLDILKTTGTKEWQFCYQLSGSGLMFLGSWPLIKEWNKNRHRLHKARKQTQSNEIGWNTLQGSKDLKGSKSVLLYGI